jgi:chemotaxis signal transduction protein
MSNSEDPAAHINDVLRERARKLAAAPPEAGAPEASNLLLVFRAAGGRYAIPLSQAIEVLNDRTIAGVPGAPPHVAGLVQVRGEIVPVLRLPATKTPNVESMVVVVKTAERLAGIVVEEVEQISPMGVIHAAPAGSGAHTRSVTEESIAILDLEAVLGKD